MRKLLACILALLISAPSAQILPGILAGGAPAIVYGTITRVQTSAGGGFGTSVATDTLPAAPSASGDILVCMSNLNSTTRTIVVSDVMTDGGGAWQTAHSYVDSTTTGSTVYIFWRVLGGSANVVASIVATETGGTGQEVYIGCSQFHTTAGTFHVDGTPVAANGTGTTWTMGAITVASSSGLVFVGSNSINDVTAGTGYTRYARNGSPYYIGAIYSPTTMFTAGSKATTQVITGGAGWNTIAAGFSAY